MVGFGVFLILAAIVSKGARGLIGGLITLALGGVLLLASCGIS